MTHYVPVRGADGKIIVDPDELRAYQEQQAHVEQPASPRATQPHNLSDLLPSPQPTTTRRPPLAIIIPLLLVALVAALIVISRPVPVGVWRTPAQPTIAPTPASLPSAAVTPQPTASGPIFRQAVVVYASPNGELLGAVEQGRAYRFVGRYGDDWLQSDVEGSGKVWLRRDAITLDNDDLAAIAALPDLAPPTATPWPTAIPQPARPAQAPAVAPNTAQYPYCAESLRAKACAQTEVRARELLATAEAEQRDYFATTQPLANATATAYARQQE